MAKAPQIRAIRDSSVKNDDSFVITTSLCVFVLCTALFARVLFVYQPHSGQDNHHGSKNAYGGDYEAQRHWMELTWHLPIGDWYYHDLQYWGLDYPPLTAYVSFVCGAFSEWLVGPETVALESSRGYENDPTHKTYMRATVWVLDAIVYFPAAYCILKILFQSKTKRRQTDTKQQQQQPGFDYEFTGTYLLSLLQPSILLIDHGHFQYNTVALGLTLWSLYFMTKPDFSGCICGSVFFCLALNFKQMTLYYAPVIFAYLLGRCFASGPSNNLTASQGNHFLQRFVVLGLTVVFSFGIMWWPFLAYGPSDEVPSDSALSLVANRGKHVLHRIFPLERGLFEGKVSNLWCALDTKPINIRQRIPATIQPLAALGMTVLLMMPACVMVFLVGKASELRSSSKHSRHASDLKAMLWGATSSALSFFLASFQVHEKSVLLALATASMLGWDDALFCDWFGVVAAWTMWPLLVVDRLQVAYVCSMTLFVAGVWQLRTPSQDNATTSLVAKYWRALSKLSFLAMLGLHLLEMVVEAPSHLPDLFPVLWSVGGCALCCLAWIRTIGSLLSSNQTQKNDLKSKFE